MFRLYFGCCCSLIGTIGSLNSAGIQPHRGLDLRHAVMNGTTTT
ncbi:hypothetical protein AB3S75_028576 [Citrus x aurantiifolia]